MEVRSKPGIIPNSLIIKPEIQAPVMPKKFEGNSSETKPHPLSVGSKVSRIKKVDIEIINKIRDVLFLKSLIKSLLSEISLFVFTIYKNQFTMNCNVLKTNLTFSSSLQQFYNCPLEKRVHNRFQD